MLSFRVERQNWGRKRDRGGLASVYKPRHLRIFRLTFGAYSAIAYPVSLKTFTRGGGNMIRQKLPSGTQALLQQSSLPVARSGKRDYEWN